MKTTLALAGLLSLGSTTLASTFPEYFTASIQALDPESALQGQYFRPGLSDHGDTMIALSDKPLYFYINETTSQLVMTDFYQGVVGNGYVDSNDKGILKFSNDPDAHEYAMFGRSPDGKTMSLLGASDRWFWCAVGGQANGTVAIGTVAGLEGCEMLTEVETSATD